MSMIDVDLDPGEISSQINLRFLAAAAPFASKDKHRPHLQGVIVEFDAKGATYTATDGSRLICCRREIDGDHDNALFGRFTIPVAYCKAKLDKNDDGNAKIFERPDGLITLIHGAHGVFFEPIDGPFVNWRRVIPTKVNGMVSQFNLSLLGDFTEFALELSIPMPFIAHNGDGPALVWFAGFPDALGLISPSKAIDQIDRVPPNWAKPRAGDDAQGDIEDAIDAAKTEDAAGENVTSFKRA